MEAIRNMSSTVYFKHNVVKKHNAYGAPQAFAHLFSGYVMHCTVPNEKYSQQKAQMTGYCMK